MSTSVNPRRPYDSSRRQEQAEQTRAGVLAAARRLFLELGYAGMTAFAHHLHEGGHLRSGVSTEEARDVLWAHTSVELWDLLVRQRGWSQERFGAWVAAQLIAALLPA